MIEKILITAHENKLTCFLQMKIPHFCKMGAGKFASSLQHYNCIFQSCQRFANAHSYGLCP